MKDSIKKDQAPEQKVAAEDAAKGVASAKEMPTAEKPAKEDAAAETPVEADAAETPVEAESPSEEDAAEKPTEPNWKDMYARTLADFDNFRKRTARDREDLVKGAAATILKDLLTTVDNLALALDKAPNKEDAFVAGVKMVYDGFLKTLSAHGAEPLDSVGEPFDANFHEALATLPSDEVPEGVVMNEVKRGWLLHGKLLRVAQVVVSAGKKA